MTLDLHIRTYNTHVISTIIAIIVIIIIIISSIGGATRHGQQQSDSDIRRGERCLSPHRHPAAHHQRGKTHMLTSVCFFYLILYFSVCKFSKHILSLSLSLSHTHSHTHTHAHTHNFSHIHTLTHSLTHLHSLFFFLFSLPFSHFPLSYFPGSTEQDRHSGRIQVEASQRRSVSRGYWSRRC